MSFVEIAEMINAKSTEYEIGNFYEIRKNIDPGQRIYHGGLFRVSGSHSEDDWGYAFHYGGRKELQFNIGFESYNEHTFRYGVAFSLETDRNFHDQQVIELIGKIQLFNQYMDVNAGLFEDFSLWENSPGQIPVMSDSCFIERSIQTAGKFIFFGKKCGAEEIDCEAILIDLCRLLRIFIYIESKMGGAEKQLTSIDANTPALARKEKLNWTIASYVDQQICVELRHNELQRHLVSTLRGLYGSATVFEEYPCQNNCRIDVFVETEKESIIYEIKTNHSARLCVRAAIGQLLEYAIWPGAAQVTKLIVVGEGILDQGTADYLTQLNTRFPIEIAYERVALNYCRK